MTKKYQKEKQEERERQEKHEHQEDHENQEHKKFHGDIIVSSVGEIEIKVDGDPDRIFVEFIDECHPIPCGPSHVDKVWWEVREERHKHHDHFMLVICWDVSGCREIRWTICY